MLNIENKQLPDCSKFLHAFEHSTSPACNILNCSLPELAPPASQSEKNIPPYLLASTKNLRQIDESTMMHDDDDLSPLFSPFLQISPTARNVSSSMGGRESRSCARRPCTFPTFPGSRRRGWDWCSAFWDGRTFIREGDVGLREDLLLSSLILSRYCRFPASLLTRRS
ncbi:hypothetical protein GY45DRAFT_207759 [Cubamyces sp. BRFM 1775]|nr:hypothetical protein GY45DRAFT_207759 [Cubamyces sp. BRFM 1775]